MFNGKVLGKSQSMHHRTFGDITTQIYVLQYIALLFFGTEDVLPSIGPSYPYIPQQ